MGSRCTRLWPTASESPERKKIFTALAALERKHADSWARRLQELGAEVPASHSGKAHAVRITRTPGGMQEIISAIEAEERRDVSSYLKQMREIKDEETRAILREVVSTSSPTRTF